MIVIYVAYLALGVLMFVQLIRHRGAIPRTRFNEAVGVMLIGMTGLILFFMLIVNRAGLRDNLGSGIGLGALGAIFALYLTSRAGRDGKDL